MWIEMIEKESNYTFQQEFNFFYENFG